MTNYIIEDNLDFYSELNKMLDQSEDESENNCCLITHQPLTDKHFMMKCGHTFNYIPLYNDIKNHKQKFNVMERIKLKQDEIRCPYCRNKQYGCLPYYEELGLDKIGGVNCIMDDTLNTLLIDYCNYETPNSLYGKPNEPPHFKCYSYVCKMNYKNGGVDGDKYYCGYHKKIIVKKFKLDAKNKAKEDKLAATAKAKEDKLVAAAKAKEDKLAAAAKAKEDKLAAAAKAKEEKLVAAAKAKEEKLVAAAKAKEEKLAAAAKAKEDKLLLKKTKKS